MGSKLRARCAPDERQKQEFRGLCACQHASPCPNPVKHQALCEFVQFLTYCVKEVNNETYKWRIEENYLQSWRIRENKIVSGCRRRRLTADVEHCLHPERKLRARMNHLQRGRVSLLMGFSTWVDSTSQESSCPCCSLFKAGKRTLLTVTVCPVSGSFVISNRPP